MLLNSSQGTEYHPAQFPSGDGWSAAGVNSDDSSVQPQEGPPPQVTQHPAGSRLLSNWKSSRLQLINDAEKSARISLVEQETLKQFAVEGPITGTAFNSGIAQ